ncbi:extracellular catalytic domain type 2 short-chain-length polyhydroxyalkanoate depolymerase [Arenimonas malthae]|nr:PHB depolymerase family esterase [Arenimonas malthae]
MFPREFSQRAAQAARVFIPAALALALAACAAEPAPRLPELDIDPDRVAVAGLSSGAYMATQVHLAHSDRLRGAALLAGGPYGCAGASLETALGPCMVAEPYAPDPARLAGVVRERAAAGDIAPVSGLAGDAVYVLRGRADTVVAEAVTRSAHDLYAALADDAGGLSLHYDGGRDFPHLMPTLDAGVDCATGGTPYLGRCGFDAAGEAMAWLFGPASSPAPATAAGELRRFDQAPYAAPGADPLLAEAGYLYLPPACAAGGRCGLLVAFHGCEQNADKVGEAFVRDAGFNRWADVHRVAVLYPQVRSSYLPLNPKACWDWWGYTGEGYDTRRGAQPRWLAAAMTALGAPMP